MTVAWIFPGQGSQVVGMGRDLYASIPAAREVFDQADEVLDINITRLCFEGPEKDLIATENAQPALVTVSAALLRAIESLKPTEEHQDRPLIVAGHSLGEYSALLSCDSIDLPTAITLVRRRGELMAESNEGKMAAIIGLNEDVVDEVCQGASQEIGEPVVVANYNAPGQLVISGATAAVDRACELAKDKKAKRAIPLKVSAAFHSPLMTKAAEGMAIAVADAPIGDVEGCLVGNVQAQPVQKADDIRRELVDQVVSPVRWIASIQYMVKQGVSTFVEIGPGNVLTGLIKRIAPGVSLVNLSNVEDVQAFAVAQNH